MSSTKKESATLTETELGIQLHLSGVSADGNLLRTTRFDSGSWLSFEDVQAKAGPIPFPRDVSIQSFDNNLHICVTDNFGQLWHAIRHIDGSWQSFINVKTFTGHLGVILKVAIGRVGSTYGGELHVCGVTGDAHLWHTIRRADGSWLPFRDVEGPAGERGAMDALACAGNGAGELHLCATSGDGHLWHTIRRADGAWFPFGDVEGQAGERGDFIDVDCAVINNELHVCGVTTDGHLWHTIRRTDGSWDSFADVEGQAGERGDFARIAITELYGGQLEVVGITGCLELWHTIRRADGTWIPFSDVEGKVGERRKFLAVSAHGMYFPS
jgi:hypothetical protein